MSTGKVVVGTLAGLTAGAILGVLAAPEKGSKTRKKLAEKGNKIVDELKGKVNSFANGVAEKAESVKM